MSVDPADAGRIAALARLRLDGEEAVRLTEELNRILEHVDALAAVADGSAGADGEGASGTDEAPGPGDAPSVPPASPSEPDGLLREPADDAPDFRDGFFAVPRLPGMDGGEEGA